MRKLIVLIGLLISLVSVSNAQALRGNEWVAGAALNIALRGPYITKSWRQPIPRFILAQAISITYERFVDVNLGRAGHNPKADIGGRLGGYLVMELIVIGVKKIL